MKKVEASVVCDLNGNIVSITRLSEKAPQGVTLVPLAGDGTQIFKVDLNEEEIEKIVGTHRFDPARNLFVPY